MATLLVLLAPPSAGDEVLPDGWVVRYVAEGVDVVGHASHAALALEAGDVPHPHLSAGPWEARWEGVVMLPDDGLWSFGLEVAGGHAGLAVRDDDGTLLAYVLVDDDGTVHSDVVALQEGAVQVSVEYAYGGEGPARVRPLWSLDFGDDVGFPWRPIGSRMVSVPETSLLPVRESLLRERGRVLLERKGCTACHAPERASAVVGVRRGPILDGIGDRAAPGWLSRWIASPHAVRPFADMPDLLGDGARAAGDRAALVELLGALRRDGSPLDRARARESGRQLYHRIGCAACHGALDAAHATDVAPLAPFGDLTGKWREDALAAMLRDPASVYPDGRMPALDLQPEEARDIATFLTATWNGGGPGLPSLAAGVAAFGRHRCGACHEARGIDALAGGDRVTPSTPPALIELEPGRGCLDPDDGATPRYALSAAERSALAAALVDVRAASGAHAPLDRSRSAVATLGCLACHARDGVGGPDGSLRPLFTTLDEEVDLGDEGRFPPDISGVGTRLSTSWLVELLEGDGRSRPWMATRMPSYGGEVIDGLAEELARSEGLVPHADLTWPQTTDEGVLRARTLLGPDGMDCMTCHVYGDLPPSASPGLDVTAFGARLRYEWFRAFLHDPQALEPGTRMPAFASGGRSLVDGSDFSDQIDALWMLFGLGEAMPAPSGLADQDALLVEVGERPVVLRTFLEHAGSRGIAVGFPVGVHVAFDAGAVRLTDAWQGPFLDASGAWAGRGGSVSGSEGEVLWIAPAGTPIVIGAVPETWPAATGREAGYRFGGYRLDADGVPTFLYRVATDDGDEVAVTERIVPFVSPSAGFARTCVLSGLGSRDAVLRFGETTRIAEVVNGTAEVLPETSDVPCLRLRPTDPSRPVAIILEVIP